MEKVIFLNSHPIQYFTPLYKYLTQQGINTTAWYCTDETLGTVKDKEFGVEIKWDIPLLEGYDYEFFKNASVNPSHANGFWGLVNWGVIKQIRKMPKSLIIVHGWHYFTHALVIILAGFWGHKIGVRCDVPQKQEALKKGWKADLKRWVYKTFIFSRVDYGFYVGEQNRLYYKSFGIKDEQLKFCPYAVDNARFQAEGNVLNARLPEIKSKLGIPHADQTIIFSGKYIEKKKPLDLLKAFNQLNKPDCWLIMVGEGHLRVEMEAYIAKHNLSKVILTGFINQSAISEYYAIGDVFVMCSELGENWGLSVNEAMNFNLPVILSDLTGCSDDLVQEGSNGYIFKTGDIDELTICLKHILIDQKLSLNPNSLEIVERYSFLQIFNCLKELIDSKQINHETKIPTN